MKRIAFCLLLVSFSYFSIDAQPSSVTIKERIQLFTKKAKEKFKQYIPNRILINEGYSIDLEVGFPNGYTIDAEENIHATIRYELSKSGKKIPFDLEVSLRSDGTIKANYRKLFNKIIADWDFKFKIGT